MQDSNTQNKPASEQAAEDQQNANNRYRLDDEVASEAQKKEESKKETGAVI